MDVQPQGPCAGEWSCYLDASSEESDSGEDSAEEEWRLGNHPQPHALAEKIAVWRDRVLTSLSLLTTR